MKTVKRILTVFTVAAVALVVAGCTTSEYHGLTLIVGEHFSLPKLTQESTNTDLEIYNSTQGAIVKCRKDCRVEVDYDQANSNHIALVWDKYGRMRMRTVVEPCEIGGSETNSVEGVSD